MENDNPTTEALQNPPEEAGASHCPDAGSLEEQILNCADYTYIRRRQAIQDAGYDEEKFREAFKAFQRSATRISSHARAIHRYCEDVQTRISAVDILDRVRMDIAQTVLTAQRFEERADKDNQLAEAEITADLKLDGIHLYDRLSVTIQMIKSGKDAELAIRAAHEKAIEKIAPRVKHTFEATQKKPFSPIYTYPIPLPPKDEPLPEFPAAFTRFVLLPPEDMERYPNGAFRIPAGYRDANGEDLTHLWDVDWENGGKVTSGPTEEETVHGTREWVSWCRETPKLVMPPDCKEFYKRHLEKELGLAQTGSS